MLTTLAVVFLVASYLFFADLLICASKIILFSFRYPKEMCTIIVHSEPSLRSNTVKQVKLTWFRNDMQIPASVLWFKLLICLYVCSCSCARSRIFILLHIYLPGVSCCGRSPRCAQHRIESMLMKRFFRSRPVPAPRQSIERASNISTTIWDGRRDMVICFGIITHRRKGLRHYQLDNLQLYTSCELNLCCSVTLFRCAPKS